METTASVYVVDDDDAVRDAVQRLLRAEGWRPRCFASGEALLAALRPRDFGCLVLDINMGGIDGLTLQQRLLDTGADLSIVFLTGHGDVPTTVRAFRAGAVNFLEKPVAGEELLSSVREALERAHRARRERARRDTHHARLESLTSRERQVLARIVKGESNKEIARHLGISHRTVESHRARIMTKTEAENLPALVSLVTLGGAERTDA